MKAIVLVLALGIATVTAGCSSTPDTPGNATIGLADAYVLGSYNGVWNGLCANTQAEGIKGGSHFDSVMALLRGSGNIYADNLPVIRGEHATEVVDVRPLGVKEDSRNQRWTLTLTKEGGKWRVCSASAP